MVSQYQNYENMSINLKKDVELIYFKIDQINKKKEQIDKLKAPRKA